jgi:hypothetical protein
VSDLPVNAQYVSEAEADGNAPTEQIKDIIQDLFQVMVQTSNYDSAGKSSREVLSTELYVRPFPSSNPSPRSIQD